jgi:hypothetical protein
MLQHIKLPTHGDNMEKTSPINYSGIYERGMKKKRISIFITHPCDVYVYIS